VYLTGVHLTGVYLMGVHLMGVVARFRFFTLAFKESPSPSS
jgi:hypothetical protein